MRSIKSADDLMNVTVNWIPHSPQLFDNYSRAAEALQYGKFLLNSLFLTILPTIGAVLSASLVGYGFARYNFKGRGILFMLVLLTLIAVSYTHLNSPPTTIKQLDEMAAKLYKPNKAGDGYDQVGFYPWFWLMLEYPNLLTKPFGGDWTNADGYPTANSAEVIAALEWMMGYVKKYGFDKVNNSLSKLVNENNMYGHALAMNMSFSAQLNACLLYTSRCV